MFEITLYDGEVIYTNERPVVNKVHPHVESAIYTVKQPYNLFSCSFEVKSILIERGEDIPWVDETFCYEMFLKIGETAMIPFDSIHSIVELSLVDEDVVFYDEYDMYDHFIELYPDIIDKWNSEYDYDCRVDTGSFLKNMFRMFTRDHVVADMEYLQEIVDPIIKHSKGI